MSSYPDLIVDMHTHLFNARYVPLNEILRSRKVPPGLSHLVARLVIALTRKSNLNKMDEFQLTDSDTDKADQLMAQIADITVEQFSSETVEAFNSAQLLADGADEANYIARSSLEDVELCAVLADIDREFGDEASNQELNLVPLENALSEKFAKQEKLHFR